MDPVIYLTEAFAVVIRTIETKFVSRKVWNFWFLVLYRAIKAGL